MANPVKGEVSFAARGKKFTLVYSANAYASLEEELNCGIFDIYDKLKSWSPPRDQKGKPKPETTEQMAARMAGVRFGFARAVFWAGLLDHHPEITIGEAGNLISEVGGIVGVYGLIMDGVVKSMPTDQEGGGSSRPPKEARKHGTGRAS